MELHPDQFHEHLAEFERLGLKIGPNQVTLPGGHRLGVIQQSIHLRGDPETGWERSYMGSAPSEKGGMHFVTAEAPSHQQGSVDFDVGHTSVKGINYNTFYDPKYSWARDPQQFSDDVRHLIEDAQPPAPHIQSANRQLLQEETGRRGIVEVQYSSPAHGNSRWYNFHQASGQLERVEL